MFEDSGGNIWVSAMSNDAGTGIARLEKDADKFHQFTESEGLPAGKAFSSAAQDLQGNVWFSLYDGGAARFRNEKFEYFEKPILWTRLCPIYIWTKKGVCGSRPPFEVCLEPMIRPPNSPNSSI